MLLLVLMSGGRDDTTFVILTLLPFMLAVVLLKVLFGPITPVCGVVLIWMTLWLSLVVFVLSFSWRFFFWTWERLMTLIGLTSDDGVRLNGCVVVVDCFVMICVGCGCGGLVSRGAVILVIFTSGAEVEAETDVCCCCVDCTTGKLD